MLIWIAIMCLDLLFLAGTWGFWWRAYVRADLLEARRVKPLYGIPAEQIVVADILVTGHLQSGVPGGEIRTYCRPII